MFFSCYLGLLYVVLCTLLWVTLRVSGRVLSCEIIRLRLGLYSVALFAVIVALSNDTRVGCVGLSRVMGVQLHVALFRGRVLSFDVRCV